MTTTYAYFVFIITVYYSLRSTFSLSHETLIQYDTCKRKYFSCNSPSAKFYCRCDSSCTYYDDCCFDGNTGVIEDKSETLYFINRTTCEPISFFKDGRYVMGVFMLSSCPENWQGDDTKLKCLQSNSNYLMDILPVLDIKTNLTYKNIYCAKCNEVYDTIPWKMNVSCEVKYMIGFEQNDSLSTTIFERINSPLCSHRFVPLKTHDIRYCHPLIPYLIDPSPNQLYSNFSKNRAMAPVKLQYTGSNDVHFLRNMEFLLPRKGLERLNCLAGPVIDSFSAGKYTVSSLIDVSGLIYKDPYFERCSETEAFLSDQVGCHQLYCPFNFRCYYGECIQTDTVSPYSFEFLFQWNPFGKEEDPMFKRHVRMIMSDILIMSSEFAFWVSDLSYFLMEIVNGKDSTSTENCSFIKVQLPFQLKTGYNNNLEDIQWHFRFGILFNYSRIFSLLGLFQHVENVDNASCKVNKSVLNPRYIFNRFPSWIYLPCAAVRVDNSTGIHSSRRVFKNVSSAEENSFYINGIPINPTDVFTRNGHYYICVESFQAKYNKKNLVVSDYRHIVNIICTCVSILCLICCLIHYCVIPLMFNQKSHLMIVLICFLLLAHACLLLNTLTSFRDEICIWLGAIHHFAWLGSFVFMFLCSLRLNYDIRKLYVESGARTDYLSTVKYCLVGFISTSFITLGTKLLDLIKKNMESIYGGDVCFIADTYTLLFAFVVPVSVILCGNLVLFILIIYHISSTSIISANQSKKSNIVVYAKISASMGFSWILGIVAVLTNIDLLLMIFEIMASLQGTFLTISVLWNDRVKKFYTKIFIKTET